MAPSPTSSTASDSSEETAGGEQASEDAAEGVVTDGEGPSSGASARAVNAPEPEAVNRRAKRASNLAERRREAKEDRALVEKAQQGDRDAFRQLVLRHQRRAFAIAIGVVRDENDAREIVQEAFLRVHKSLDKFEGSSSFFTWLYRIVKNLSIDFIRKPARRETELFDDPKVADDAELFPFVSPIAGADPLDEVRRQEIGARIQEALDELPPYHRSVIIMREIEGMSYQQMAEAMEVSKGTIMSRLYHARQKLQKALADCYREQLGTDPDERSGPSERSERGKTS